MVNMQIGHGSPVTLYSTNDIAIGDAANPIRVAGTVTETAIPSTTATTAQTTVSSTAVLILAANNARLAATVENPAGPNTIYWGQTSGVTTATGFPIPAGSAYSFDFPNYTGAVYAITTGTGQLSATVELT